MRYTALTLIAIIAAAAATGVGLQASLAIIDTGTPSAPTAPMAPNPDQDSDRIPDSLEGELCLRPATATAIKLTNLGSCNGADYTPPGTTKTATVPSFVSLGIDDDGDLLPGFVTVTMIDLTITPFGKDVVTMAPAGTIKMAIDEDDQDANVPAKSTVVVQQPIPGGIAINQDEDGDGLPGTATLQLMQVSVDRSLSNLGVSFAAGRTVVVDIDPDDKDAGNPVVDQVRASIPYRVSHNGDGDGDLLPGKIVFDFLTLTVDRTQVHEVGTPATMEAIQWGTATKTLVVDEDDSDRDSVIPYSMYDPDGDLIPDGAEPAICMLQKQQDPSDGVCVKSDGTGHDGSGDNYVPPVIGGLLDLVFDPQTLNALYEVPASSFSSQEEIETAPGIGFVLSCAMLAGLALALRRA